MRFPRLRQPFKKQVVSSEEWETVREDAAAAKELLEDPRFAFFRDYLANVQSSIVDKFVNNKLRPVQEHVKISDVLSRVLSTSKEEQEQELSGKYQLVDSLLADLRYIAGLPEEYKKAEKEGKIEIEASKEKDG